MCSFFFYFWFVRHTLSANELCYTSPEHTYSYSEAPEWTFVSSATFILVKQQMGEIGNQKKTPSQNECLSPGKVAACRVESFYTELHNLRLLLVNSATAEDAWWLLVLHRSCLPPGGRQGGSYVHLTADQWANVCGTCPGCLATRGSGQAENEAKKRKQP